MRAAVVRRLVASILLLALLPWPVHAEEPGALPSPDPTKDRRIAVLDGRIKAYGPEGSRPNWKVLKSILVDRVFKGEDLDVDHFDVSVANANNVWVGPEHLVGYEVVLAHWSAFEPPRGKDFCDIVKNAEADNCAVQLLQNFVMARDQNGRKSRVVIYSQANNLCNEGRLIDFNSAISSIGGDLPSLDGTIGFMTMTSLHGRNTFADKPAQDALSRLVQHLECPTRHTLFSTDQRDGVCRLGGPPAEEVC